MSSNKIADTGKPKEPEILASFKYLDPLLTKRYFGDFVENDKLRGRISADELAQRCQRANELAKETVISRWWFILGLVLVAAGFTIFGILLANRDRSALPPPTSGGRRSLPNLSAAEWGSLSPVLIGIFVIAGSSWFGGKSLEKLLLALVDEFSDLDASKGLEWYCHSDSSLLVLCSPSGPIWRTTFFLDIIVKGTNPKPVEEQV